MIFLKQAIKFSSFNHCHPQRQELNASPNRMGVDAEPSVLVRNSEFFEKAAWPLIAMSALITAVLLMQLVTDVPAFHTQLADFAPETEGTMAEERISPFFENESRPMFVHVTAKNDGNVLSLENLSIQLNHLRQVQEWGEANQDFIAANTSAPGIVQLALDEKADGMALENVSSWSGLVDLIIDDNITCTGEKDTQLESVAAFAQAGLLHRDFDPAPTCDYLAGHDVDPTPVARSTLWVIEVDTEVSDDLRQVKMDMLRQKFAELSQSSDLQYSVASLDLVSHDIDQGTFENLVTLIVIAVVVVVSILALAFRSFRGVTFPLVGLSLALIWTYGTLAAMDAQFTALEVAIAPLVLGLGIDYTIHLQRRYEELRAEGHTPAESWLMALEKLSVALSLAVITTVAAFLANVLSPLPPVRTFGLGLAFGVISAFLCSTVVVGCLHVVMDRREGKGRIVSRMLTLPQLSRRIVNFQKRQQVLVIITAILICSVSLFGALKLETEFDLADFLDDDMEIMQVRGHLNESYEASSWKYVYLFFEGVDENSIEDDLDLLDQLSWLDERLAFVHGVVGWEGGNPSYEGPYTVLRDAVIRDPDWGRTHNLEMFGDELVEINASTDIALGTAFANLSVNESTADPLSGRTWSERVGRTVHLQGDEIIHMRMEVRVVASTSSDSQLVISSFERELGSVDQVGTLRSGLAGNAQVYLGGDLVKLQAVLQGLTTSQVESTALSLIVSLFVLMVLTRRIIPALIVLLPIGVATLWVVGSMVLFGLKWNVLTVMVTALTIGIGIDYSIHVWRRFEIEMENNQGKPWKAMETVISTTGVALMLSAGTTVCGFLVLLFSPMPVVQDFGLVTAITVVFSLILSIFFLPVLLAMNATMSESNGNSDGQSDQ